MVFFDASAEQWIAECDGRFPDFPTAEIPAAVARARHEGGAPCEARAFSAAGRAFPRRAEIEIARRDGFRFFRAEGLVFSKCWSCAEADRREALETRLALWLTRKRAARLNGLAEAARAAGASASLLHPEGEAGQAPGRTRNAMRHEGSKHHP